MIAHVPTRLDLIRNLPGKALSGAEVGVSNGDFSAELLSLPNIERLYLIDPNVCDRFQSEARAEVLRETSLAAVRRFYYDRNPLDFVFLDATHDYHSVTADLAVWSRIAPVLFVHDFIQNEPADTMGFAVVRAVHDFCRSHGWHVTALTDDDEWPTCELRQITVTGI